MIDLGTYSIAELFQLYADCQKMKLLAKLGIKPTQNEALGRVNTQHLVSELTALENHILYILNEDVKEQSL